MPVAIYSLQGIRDAILNRTVAQAMTTGSLMRAKRVRRDAHEPGSSCIVHTSSTCLSA
jgi:hypothetical protein